MKNLLLIVETNKNKCLINTINSININYFKENNSDIYCLYSSNLYDTFNIDKINFIKIKEYDNNLLNYINVNNYDNLVYINNNFVIDNINNIFSFIPLFEDLNINQIIFNNFTGNYNLYNFKDNNFKIPIINNYDYEDPYTIFKKQKITLQHVKNPFPKKEQNLNYMDYYNKINNNYYFKLNFSLIKIKQYATFPIINDTYEVNIFGKYLKSLNYKTIYYDDKIFVKENDKLIEDISETININSKIDDVTYVTGFFLLKTDGGKKHKYNYLEKSIKTLSISKNMYIFISSDIYDHVYNIRKNLNLLDKTKIVIIDEKNLYMIQHYNKINENIINNWKPYDNPYYIMCVATRNNYVKSAIEDNYFKTNYFIWVDFGLNHIVNIPDNFHLHINQNYKIRIGWVARVHRNNFVFNHETLAGGLYGGHYKALLNFFELHDKWFIRLMNRGLNINNDKVLFYMFEEYPELFDVYCSAYSNIFIKFNN